jgi:DNA (cytosine-5)-methyltransferase 1
MVARPRLLDLFCGAGGAAMGYHRAGFEVTGVDIEPQPRYPFEFVQADAMTFPLAGFDAVHASPPCQDHMRSGFPGQVAHGTGWMLGVTRERLMASGVPWVIENVPGASMRVDYKLCGCLFGLRQLVRERWFETSWQGFDLRSPCFHPEGVLTVAGHDVTSWQRATGYTRDDRKRVMGIDWMSDRELGLAIPPAYTEYIGGLLLAELALI